MARAGPLLALLGLVATPALAAFAFITIPGSRSAPQQAPRQAIAGEVLAGAAVLPEGAAVEQEGEQAPAPAPLKWLAAGLLAGLVMAVNSAPAEASANSAKRFAPEKFTIKAAKHLELCKNNKKYHKKIKDQVYKVTQRQKKYPKGSVVFNRFEKKIKGIRTREEAYGERYCGKKDGIPRVIATGENVRGGVVIPALMFLYTAGWIGWAGRSYLRATQDKMKELNLDVPLALTCMASGFSWPVAAWQDIVNGEMVANDKDIHRSFF